MITAKMTQSKTVQMPAVCNISARTYIGVERGDDYRCATGNKNAVYFLKELQNVPHMLDYVDRPYLSERPVPERQYSVVKVGDNICDCSTTPGTYTLSFIGMYGEPLKAAHRSVDVVDRDVETTLDFAPPVTIHGTMLLDGA